MPELPEVETIRRDLEKEFAGTRVSTVEVSGLRSVRRQGSDTEFVARLAGRTIDGVGRKGKYLLIGLDDGDVLVAHLGMSGQLLVADAADPLPKHAHVVVGFNHGQQLRFVDPRTFGQLFVTTGKVSELDHLGLDPLDQVLGPKHLGVLLGGRKTKLKVLLMDQRFLAGIGNIYSDEILFSARLGYDRSSEGLSAGEVGRLHQAMIDTLTDAIEHRGSSLADEQYRDIFGAIGGYQSHHQVYDREGQDCPRCGDAIVRMKANGRSTFFCARCQMRPVGPRPRRRGPLG